MSDDILRLEVFNDHRRPTRKVTWVEGARSLALYVGVWHPSDPDEPRWAEVSVASLDAWWHSERPSASEVLTYAMEVLADDDRWNEFESFGG